MSKPFIRITWVTLIFLTARVSGNPVVGGAPSLYSVPIINGQSENSNGELAANHKIITETGETGWAREYQPGTARLT